MSATQHTPGPWEYAETPCIYHQAEIGRTYSVYGRNDFSGPIALLRRDSNERIPFEDAEANARLIASSPELLSALRRAEAALSFFIDDEGEPDVEALDEARAAIAKAEGRVS